MLKQLKKKAEVAAEKATHQNHNLAAASKAKRKEWGNAAFRSYRDSTNMHMAWQRRFERWSGKYNELYVVK